MALAIAACSCISRYSANLLAAVSFSHGALEFYGSTAVVLVGPSAHIVCFALEAQYGRSPLCFNGRLLAGLFSSSQEMQAAVWRAGKYAREGGGTEGKKNPLFLLPV